MSSPQGDTANACPSTRHGEQHDMDLWKSAREDQNGRAIKIKSVNGLPNSISLGTMTARETHRFEFKLRLNDTFSLSRGEQGCVALEADRSFFGATDGRPTSHTIVLRVTAGEPGPLSDRIWLCRQGMREHPIEIKG